MKISKHIIFDLDGTLWNTINCVTDAWNKALIEKGKAQFQFTNKQLQLLVGQSRNEIFETLFSKMNPADLADCSKLFNPYMFEAIKVKGGLVYDGVEQVIKHLNEQGYYLYIVSNCQVGYINLFLEQTQLQTEFLDQECYGATLLPKGESIKLLMNRNNINEAIYVGDTQGDYNAANYAGLPFIFAAYGFGNVIGNVASIATISELISFI